MKMECQEGAEGEPTSGFGILSSLKSAFVNCGENQLEVLINLILAPNNDYLHGSVRTP